MNIDDLDFEHAIGLWESEKYYEFVKYLIGDDSESDIFAVLSRFAKIVKSTGICLKNKNNIDSEKVVNVYKLKIINGMLAKSRKAILRGESKAEESERKVGEERVHFKKTFKNFIRRLGLPEKMIDAMFDRSWYHRVELFDGLKEGYPCYFSQPVLSNGYGSVTFHYDTDRERAVYKDELLEKIHGAYKQGSLVRITELSMKGVRSFKIELPKLEQLIK